MNIERKVKRSKAIEIQLVQAAGFLHEPGAYHLRTDSLEDYAQDLKREELELAMESLEELALVIGCKPGFWRRLKKVADSLDNKQKAERYEQEFHNAMARNI